VDATDIVTGAVGIALGIAAARRYGSAGSGRYGEVRGSGGIQFWPAVGVMVWAAVLLGYHWRPFDFTLTREMLDRGRESLLAVPFRGYYFGTEFHAFTEATRKLLLAMPLGVLLRLSWPPRRSRMTARLQTGVLLALAFGFLTAIEVGQMFLPERFADLTDAMIGEAGVLVGLWLVRLLAAPGIESGAGARDLPGTRPRIEGGKDPVETRAAR
jgi:hypothetical protein